MLLNQGAVQLGHAIDVVAAHHRQVGHAHPALRALLNQGNALQDLGIAGIANPGHAQEAGVDLVDDLKLAGQKLLKQLHAPGFQGLGQQGVVGVADAGGGDRPSGIPIDAVLIHQQPHQLSHGDGWMGVVQLQRKLAMEVGHLQPLAPQDAEHVLQGAADEEDLLGETQSLALVQLVVGVEHL